MSTEKNSSSPDEMAFTKAPIPSGVKRVRETKTEIYTEPIEAAAPQSTSAAGPVAIGVCPYCDDEVMNTEDFKRDPNGDIAHGDCITEGSPEVAPSAPESPANKFLSSLKVDEIRGSQLRIYVYREPDPIGASFRKSYTGPRKSVGPLEYDAQFDSAAAVEVYVQRLHHGGSYYFEVREGGKYATSWSRLIDDPPAPEVRAEPAAAVIPPNGPPAVMDNFQVFKQQAVEFAEVARAFGLTPRGARTDDAIAAAGSPPPSPLESITSSVTLVKSIIDLAKDMNPSAAAAGTEREPSNTELVITFARELGISELVKEGARQIGIPLLADYIRQRQMRPNFPPPPNQPPPPQPNVGTPTVQATDEGLAGGAGAAPVQSPTSDLRPLASGVPQEAIDLILRPVVEDMRSDVAASVRDENHETDCSRSVQAIISLMPFDEQLMPFVVQTILPKSGVQLLVWLGEINVEWRLLPSDTDATEYAAWLNDLRLDLRDALAGAGSQEQDGEGVSRETSPTNMIDLGSLGFAASSEMIDVEDLVSADDADSRPLAPDSEPGVTEPEAVATGQTTAIRPKSTKAKK